MADDRPTAGMTLHRFFVPPDCITGERVVFPPDQAHQIRKVLRLRTGDRVIALDGSGAELTVRLEHMGTEIVGAVEERGQNQAEPAACVVLYQGLLKGAKFELVLQKCTEIGVSRFVPVTSARSIPSEPSSARQQRFETIVREAAEQSGRGRLPAVSAARPFSSAIQDAVVEGAALLLWEDEKIARLRDVVEPSSAAIGLFVGPEGGFTQREAELASEAGARVAGLGSRILRSETAAMVASTLVLARLGELG